MAEAKKIVTDERLIEFLDTFRQLDGWGKDKVHRLIIRLLNNDKKLSKLIEMRDRGEITNWQFWRMI